MSKLIDADELKKVVEFLQDNTWPEDLSARMPRIIEEAETIPAIPVEWLREKMRGYASALKSTEMDAVVRVLKMWEEEQEG